MLQQHGSDSEGWAWRNADVKADINTQTKKEQAASTGMDITSMLLIRCGLEHMAEEKAWTRRHKHRCNTVERDALSLKLAFGQRFCIILIGVYAGMCICR